MKNIMKWVGVGLGSIVGLIVIVAVILIAVGGNKVSAGAYEDVETTNVTVPTDAASIARGEHLVESTSLCVGCHGDDYEGHLFFDDAAMMTMYGPNLTSGKGGVGATYTDEDWVQAIRHGVGKDGRGMLFMPSWQYTYMSDEDLGAVIAYIKSVPPVDNETPAREFGVPGRLILGIGGIPMQPDLIDHAMDRTPPAEAPTAEYGAYLVTLGTCRDCHGPDLAGQTDPNGPIGPNITPGGKLGGWNEADFIFAIRTGTRPDGTTIDAEEMPWEYYLNMTDKELKAVWAYLSSLEPLQDAGQ